MERRKHYLVVDANSTLLVATVTGANAHDVTQLIPLVDKFLPVGGKPSTPLQKPEEVMGDRACHHKERQAELEGRNILMRIARRDAPHGSGPGIFW